MVGSEAQYEPTIKIPSRRGVIIPASEGIEVVTQAVLFISQVIHAAKKFDFEFSHLLLPPQPELPEPIRKGIHVIGIGQG